MITDSCISSGKVFSHLKNFLEEFQEPLTVTKKMQKLCMLDCLSATDIQARFEICDIIKSCFESFYKNPEILLFGSSKSSFGAKDCDMDLLFIPFPDYCNTDYPEQSNVKIPQPGKVKLNDVLKEELHKLDEKGHLLFLRKIMRQFLRIFKSPMFINARCPILKFTTLSNISCDLSCRNRLVVENSDLLKLYSSFDKRFRHLVVTLKYWGKCLSFIRTDCFSSYAFSLLVLFFLQNTNPPVLPSVLVLKKLAETEKVIAGWDATFTNKINEIPPSQNTQSEEELLREFFEFYWNFNFSTNIVCPRRGNVLQITELTASSDARMKDFAVTAVCIQDPFLLLHNVARNVSYEALTFFKHACYIAIGKFLNPNGGGKSNFLRFFSIDEYKESLYEDLLLCNSVCMFEIGFHHVASNKFPNVELATNQSLWYNFVTQSVFDILQYALFFDCEVTNKCFHTFTETTQNFNVDALKKSLRLLISIQCSADMRTWIDRKKARGKIKPHEYITDFDSEVLSLENSVSKEVIDSNPVQKCLEPIFWFTCNCYQNEFQNLMNVIVVLIPITESKEFKCVASFLRKFIPMCVMQMLLEM